VALLDDRDRLELELANAGTSITHIALDICDVPELRAIYGEEMDLALPRHVRLRLALEWFGDGGHPQPPRAKRTYWQSYRYTQDFGQLHRLAEDELHDDVAERTPREPERSREKPQAYSWGTIAMAAATLASGDRKGRQAARDAKIKNRDDIRRLAALMHAGLVTWSPANGLEIDPVHVWGETEVNENGDRVRMVRVRYRTSEVGEWLCPLEHTPRWSPSASERHQL
jgi:hypothetical protein